MPRFGPRGASSAALAGPIALLTITVICGPVWAAPRVWRSPSAQRAVAAGQRYFGNIEPGARVLLRQMQRAEKRLDVAGQQTTILYRSNGRTIVSTQVIDRDARGDYRCEFLTPARLAGELIVSSGAASWHYMPAKRQLKLSRAHPRHLLTSVGPALKALRLGEAQARVIGTDTVAGIAVGIVEITGTGQTATGLIRIWIDPVTGAQLKTAIFDASGQPQSLSFFTAVSFTPVFAPGTFAKPVVPPGTKIVTARPPLQLQRFPSDREAGFQVRIPQFVPSGFRFVSASVFDFGDRKAVALRYVSALSLLSVFESPAQPGSRPSSGYASPRTGTVTETINGMHFAAMGTLDQNDLERVLGSMH